MAPGGTYVPLATVPLDIIVFQEPTVGGRVSIGNGLSPSGFGESRVRKQVSEGLKEEPVVKRLQQLWNDERGQDIAEYAVMLAVILVIVVGTVRLIGSNANNVFSQVGSAIQ